MKFSDEQIAELISCLPWKTSAQGYAIIKRSVLVATLKTGQIPSAKEVVHHINENRADDRPENLEILSRKEHAERHKIVEKSAAMPRIYTDERREKVRKAMLGNQNACKVNSEESTLVH